MIQRSAFIALALFPFWASATQYSQIDDLFIDYNTNSPGCALSINKNGKNTFHKGYGSANLEHAIPISRSTRFYAASTTKQFTALAIALLVQDGTLALTDSIRKYFPELPHFANDITIDQLLHHTDGIRDYFTLLFFQGRGYDNEMPTAEVFNLIAGQKAPNFKAGTEFLYANSGYLLLAQIVEAATNKTLGEFAEERIFSPLEMNDTQYVHDFRALIPRRAEGYIEKDGSWLSPRSRYAEIGPSGLVTTALDLSKWLNALRNKAFGEELAQLQVSKGRLANGTPIDYGYGFFIQKHRGLDVIQHGGGRPGYYSNLAIIPDLDLGIALLCNHSSIDTVATTNAIIEIMAGQNVIEPRAEAEVDSQILQSLEGVYSISSESNLTVTTDGKRLFAQVSGQGKYEIFPTSNLNYFWKVTDALLAFQRDKNERIDSLTITQGGLDTVATKNTQAVKAPEFSKLEDHAGRFWSEELQANYKFKVRNGVLMLAIDGLEPLTLVRESDNVFSVLGSSIEFQRDSEGRIDGLLVSAARARNVAFRRR